MALQISNILIDFSLTVKAATLIFISGRGLAISSAKEGKSGFQESIRFLGRANVHAYHESTDRISLTSNVLTLKADITKGRMFLLST